jgi:hypothetical protein
MKGDKVDYLSYTFVGSFFGHNGRFENDYLTVRQTTAGLYPVYQSMFGSRRLNLPACVPVCTMGGSKLGSKTVSDMLYGFTGIARLVDAFNEEFAGDTYIAGQRVISVLAPNKVMLETGDVVGCTCYGSIVEDCRLVDWWNGGVAINCWVPAGFKDDTVRFINCRGPGAPKTQITASNVFVLSEDLVMWSEVGKVYTLHLLAKKSDYAFSSWADAFKGVALLPLRGIRQNSGWAAARGLGLKGRR